jgi:Metallo-peptidase family M12B Reprolysin-like
MRSVVPVIVALVLVSCGSSVSQGPGAPSAPVTPVTPAPPVAQTWTLAGRLTDNITGQPVGGATLTIDGRAPVSTDGDGRWRLEGTGTAASRLATTVQAPGFVTRQTFIAWETGGRADISLDLLPDRAPFDLSFYRQLVRNAHDQPGVLQPLRRWSTNPNFYVNTFNPKTGRALEPAEITLVVQALREAVPQLTGGRFAAAAVETGDTPRAPQPNWISVSFIYDPKGDYCGLAYVGANPGEITMNYDRCASDCGSLKVAPETIAHEVGHAMGFWHTPATGIMNTLRARRCGNLQFSAQERVHAGAAYSRVQGNLDPDTDPAGFSALTVDGQAALIRCAIKPQ